MTARDTAAMRAFGLDRCAVCSGEAHHRHHIVPRSIVQCDDPENLVGLCWRCHAKVHAKTIDLGIYLTRAQAAKSVLLMGTLHAAHKLLYPSESMRRVAA